MPFLLSVIGRHHSASRFLLRDTAKRLPWEPKPIGILAGCQEGPRDRTQRLPSLSVSIPLVFQQRGSEKVRGCLNEVFRVCVSVCVQIDFSSLLFSSLELKIDVELYS